MSEFNLRLIIVICVLMILIIVFTYFSHNREKIIKYKTSQKNLKDETNIPSYLSNQEKYIKNKTCQDVCDANICTEFEHQNKKYNMCKLCKSKGKCYQPFHGTCDDCKNLKSCEEIYGCDGKEPIDPLLNECNFCWSTIY